jgi:hypothetical protein
MFNPLLSGHKRGLLTATALCAALALSACGDSSNDSPRPAPPPTGTTPTPPPVSTVDSFFAYVRNIAANLLESNEPEAIEGLVETKPENTEPEPVG